jgi:hypothetical protein
MPPPNTGGIAQSNLHFRRVFGQLMPRAQPLPQAETLRTSHACNAS